MVNTKVKTLKPKRVTSLVKDSPIFGETKDVDLDDLFSKGVSDFCQVEDFLDGAP